MLEVCSKNLMFVGRKITPPTHTTESGVFIATPFRRNVLVEVLEVAEPPAEAPPSIQAQYAEFVDVVPGTIVLLNMHSYTMPLTPEFKYGKECYMYRLASILGVYTGEADPLKLHIV